MWNDACNQHIIQCRQRHCIFKPLAGIIPISYRTACYLSKMCLHVCVRVRVQVWRQLWTPEHGWMTLRRCFHSSPPSCLLRWEIGGWRDGEGGRGGRGVCLSDVSLSASAEPHVPGEGWLLEVDLCHDADRPGWGAGVLHLNLEGDRAVDKPPGLSATHSVRELSVSETWHPGVKGFISQRIHTLVKWNTNRLEAVSPNERQGYTHALCRNSGVLWCQNQWVVQAWFNYACIVPLFLTGCNSRVLSSI